MRKVIAVTLALGLLVGALVGTAEAGKKKKKKPQPEPSPVVRVEEVVELAYNGGMLGIAAAGRSTGLCLTNPDLPFACKDITPVTPGMKYIKIEVKDASGQKVGGDISQQDADGDGFQDAFGEFCGGHEAPIPLEVESGKVTLWMSSGTCKDGTTPSIVTSGTVVATFSNLP